MKAKVTQPCPFCGRAGEIWIWSEWALTYYRYWCKCQWCDACGPMRESREGAIAAWETRVTPKEESCQKVEKLEL